LNLKQLTDTELMERISLHDKLALEELYHRYSKLIYTLIKGIIGDEKMAESILLEVFVGIFRKIKYFNFATDNPYVWIVTFARNRAVDSLRRNRTSTGEKNIYNDEYEDEYIIPIISKKIDGLDLETAINIASAIAKTFSGLTEIQRHVISKAYFEGYTVNEISQSLNLPVETIRGKLMTSVFNLRDKLMEKE